VTTSARGVPVPRSEVKYAHSAAVPSRPSSTRNSWRTNFSSADSGTSVLVVVVDVVVVVVADGAPSASRSPSSTPP
jgi:hypothetical protein